MTKDYHPSFKNDLAKIISEYNEYSYKDFQNLGNKIGGAIAQEVEKLCAYLDSLKNSPDFHNKVREKYRQSKIRPRVYIEKGLCNCDGLFFEHKFDVKGGIAIIGFYLPCFLQDDKQEEELRVFTPNITSKIKNKECVDFYFATYFLPAF